MKAKSLKGILINSLIITTLSSVPSCSSRIEKQDSDSFVDTQVVASKNLIRADLNTELDLVNEASNKFSQVLKILLEAFEGSSANIDNKVKVFVKDGQIEALFEVLTSSDLGEIQIDGDSFTVQREVSYKYESQTKKISINLNGSHNNGDVKSVLMTAYHGSESYALYKSTEGSSDIDLEELGNLLISLHGDQFDIRDLNLRIGIDLADKTIRLQKSSSSEDLEVNLFSEDLTLALTKLDLLIIDGEIQKPQQGDIEVTITSSDLSTRGVIDHEGIRLNSYNSSNNSSLDVKANIKWEQIK